MRSIITRVTKEFICGENKMSVPDETKNKFFIWGSIAMLVVFMLTVNEAYMIKY